MPVGNHSARRVPADWLNATSRAEPLNLRFERPATLSTWGSDTCISYSRDGPYGRTCHRCTCHPSARPWSDAQGLKDNRGTELYLLFLTSGVSGVEDFLRASRLRQNVPISLSCCDPVLCNLWPFWLPSSVSGFRVVALEQSLDPLDGALQLVDQIFIANSQ
jgi:hypothetical protein